jgi:hypothetical protein
MLLSQKQNISLKKLDQMIPNFLTNLANYHGRAWESLIVDATPATATSTLLSLFTDIEPIPAHRRRS